MQPYPLAGLRVADFSRVLAGPYAGRMLCDLGADVVKIEPPEGDVTRYWGQVKGGLSGFYVQQNAGKRNVCIDLKTEAGQALARDLCAQADIVVENYRPGVFDRLGLDYETLAAANPAVILLSISGFGHSGPWRDRAAYATIVQAETGLVERQAACDQAPPTDLLVSLGDMNASLHGLVAVLAAVHLRSSTGRGQHIDMAMFDCMLATDDYAHHALDGSPLVRMGGEFWETAGGPIVLAGDFRYVWRQLVAAHGLVDPSPAGADVPTKAANRRAAVGEFLRSFTERKDAVAALDAANVAWGDVRDQRAAFSLPVAVERGTAAVIDDRAGGTRRVAQSPYRFSAASSGVRGRAPYRGEHNGEVLGEWLGLEAGDVEALRASGAVLEEPVP